MYIEPFTFQVPFASWPEGWGTRSNFPAFSTHKKTIQAQNSEDTN
jgi:hypothetical protein